MANYQRTFLSSMWSDFQFERFSVLEKLFYIFLHTADETSDTSVFHLKPEQAAMRLGTSVNNIKKIIEKFEDLPLVAYDKENEEILVLDYFYHHPPKGGITFEMHRKDLAKIRSDRLLLLLAENSKEYKISRSFYLALRLFVPSMKEKDYSIEKSSKKDDEIMDAAARGRKKIAMKKYGVAEKVETGPTHPSETDYEVNDEELPF